MYGGRFTHQYSSCNKTEVAELILHTIVFSILLAIFFGTGIHTRDTTEMGAFGFFVLIALGGLIGYMLRLSVKLTICTVTE